MINTILLLLALICELCAAAGMPSSRINLGWLGLALYFLALLLGAAGVRT